MSDLISAMECWSGRTDSTTDYESFRWHQKVQPLDIDAAAPFGGKVGIAFVGFCSDQGISRNRGRTGAAAAPDYIRRQMAGLPCAFLPEVTLCDAGNIICRGVPLEEAQARLAKTVKKLLELNYFPIVLGGGHETAFGHYMGHHDFLLARGEEPELGIVNFDAHFDLRPYENGSSSGSMFLQIADLCKKEGSRFRYLPVGIQIHSNTQRLFKTACELGSRYILAKDIQKNGVADTLGRIDPFLGECDSVFMTVCADVFAASFAPGVSAAQSLGLDPEAVLPLIKHIVGSGKVCGFDICEVSPRFDHDNATANLAAVILFAVVNALCRREGLMTEFELLDNM